MADKKSSLVQIAQAVLDEATQAVKVKIDGQSIQVNVNLDETEDSVTVHQSATPWVVQHITAPVATAANQATIIGHLDGVEGSLTSIDTKVSTAAKQDEQTTKLEAVRVATIEAKDATVAAKVAVESVDAKVSTAAKQDLQTTELQAIKGHVDGVETTLTSVDNKLYSTLVAGNSSLHVTVDNQTTGLATLAEQQTQTTKLTEIDTVLDSIDTKSSSQITELQAIKGHVDLVETKLDSAITQLTALNAKSARLDAIHTSYFDYSTVVGGVTNASWVIIATVPANVEVREIAIFDSSGEFVEIGVVNAAGDVPTTVRVLVFPGGNMPMPITLTAGQVLKVRAKSVNLTSGACAINYYGVSTL